MLAREKQTEWLANLMEEYDLPKVILGTSYKPESNLEIGSASLLLKNILEKRGHKVTKYDPYVDSDTADNIKNKLIISRDIQGEKSLYFFSISL